MITWNKIQLIAGGIAIVSAVVLGQSLFNNHSVKYDSSMVDSLKKMEIRLQGQKLRLDSVIAIQDVKNEESRKFDSLLQAQYENAVNENQILLGKLNQQKDENIRHINSFDSDSLRRAYSE
jgi:hypothetical protein